MPCYHVYVEYYDGEYRWGREKNLTLEQLDEIVKSIKSKSPFLLGGRRVDSSDVSKLEIRKTDNPTSNDWDWIRYYGLMVTKDFIVSLPDKKQVHLENAKETTQQKVALASVSVKPKTQKIVKVLFLAANPKNTSRLRLDEECREVDNRILVAPGRDHVLLVNKGAVRTNDLQLYLNREMPTIVHFSCHGSEESKIILEDDRGNAREVPPKALENVFRVLKDNIRCVVLNACFSREQASAISQHIDCVIGMPSAIGDKAAIAFSAAFYLAIASGRSVENAFEQGVNELLLEEETEDNVPQLLTRNGVNASDVVLLRLEPSSEETALKPKLSVSEYPCAECDYRTSCGEKDKIFIGYVREDFEAAMKLFDELSKISGIQPWIDKKCLLPGMKWRPAIRKTIRESRFFVALLSKNSTVKRGYFQSELQQALEILREFPEDQTFLIPVRLGPCKPPVESLAELHYVDLFPDWSEGMAKVREVINQNRERKIVAKDDGKELDRYEFRCALIDLDTGLTNLPEIAKRLNEIQRFFLFTSPKVDLDIETAIKEFGGSRNLFIDELPRSLYEQGPYLNVDFTVCLTKYPIAFRQGDYTNYNYFSRPSSVDEKFMFVSTHRLYEFVKQAACTFEKGIVHMMTGQLLVYFTETGYHRETRGCVMDFCENRSDIIKGLKKKQLCKGCSANIKNPRLARAVGAILLDEIGV